MVSDWSAWSWYNLHVSILKREPLIKLLRSAWSLKLSGENKNSCALLLHDEGRSFIFLYVFLLFIKLQRRSRISHIYAGLNLANRAKVLSEKAAVFSSQAFKVMRQNFAKSFCCVWSIVNEIARSLCHFNVKSFTLNWWQHGQGVCGIKCLCLCQWKAAFVLHRMKVTRFVLIRTHCDEFVLSPRQGFVQDSRQSRWGRKHVNGVMT